jgi:hypothetical protein
MLVLALQFSRCDVTLAELGELNAAASSEVDRPVAGSLKTEEKTTST